MRITLSASDSARWSSGPDAAWEVEEVILKWAAESHVEEPEVVALADGKTVAFAFTLAEEKP
jgi:hypothetical protein